MGMSKSNDDIKPLEVPKMASRDELHAGFDVHLLQWLPSSTYSAFLRLMQARLTLV
jgi:hypothetical protein